MKTKKIATSLIVLLISMNVLVNAQEYPTMYPESQYDISAGNNGFLRRINKNNSDQVKMYAVQTLYGGAYKDIFRITTTGTATIANPNSAWYSTLQFYSADQKRAVINTDGAFNFFSANGIKFFPGNSVSSTMVLGNKYINTYVPLNMLLGSSLLEIKAGVSDDPTVFANSEKWLRIGGRKGTAIWGNENIETAGTTPSMLVIDNKVGVNTLELTDNFNVAGAIKSVIYGVDLALDTYNRQGWVGTRTNNGLYIGINRAPSLYIGTDKNLYIGMTDQEISSTRQDLKTKYNLFIKKGILSEDYSIAPINSWSDYVFNDNYQLKSIEELENYIVTNSHLPNVPSAKKVAEEGYSQHEMNKVLLEKIEELTLYIIQQQKEINNLKTKKEE